MEEKLEKVRKIIEETLDKLTVSGELEISERGDFFYFLIKTKEAGVLIGEGGQNLAALNHIVKKMSERIFESEEEKRSFPFVLDVNDYQLRKIEELKELARMQAQRVRYFKKEITLEPMSAYERRIIHSALTEYPDIMTESRGEGEGRRVVIKPLGD